MKSLRSFILESVSGKERFAEEWEKMLAKRTPMFEFPDGSYVYINYNAEDDTLETGNATNSGFATNADSVIIDVDYDRDLDFNLQGLHDVISEEHPEWFEDEEE